MATHHRSSAYEFLLQSLLVACLWPLSLLASTEPNLPNPILFVTQIPIGDDYTTIGSVFGNQKAGAESAGRGGDLYIRYPDSTLKNLTAAGGFGTSDGFQGATSIAVRDPAVDWTGSKALFSMVIGAATSQWQVTSNVWQLYEISGLGQADTPKITKVPNQPANYNNISPVYGTNGRILFASDRPRNGQAQLYPQLDEYELAPTVSGLWSLDPASGDLTQLDHAPSGAFTPTIDSFGRVIFTRWDHLQRDQEADADAEALASNQSPPYGTFNYTDESAEAKVLRGVRTEVYPELRVTVGNINRHTFNHFFPWMINEDGTAEETLNHVGRHELANYMEQSFLDDPNLVTFYDTESRFNTNYANNVLQLKEDPGHPGLFYGVDAPEFFTHASGQIITLTGAPGLSADRMQIGYITHPETKSFSATPSPNHSGHYREPVPLSNGALIAVHTVATNLETQRGVGSDYAFRLKTLRQSGTYWLPDQLLTPGITRNVSYWANGAKVNYSGTLWELNPVEVRSRAVPIAVRPALEAPEQLVFTEENVDVAALESHLRTNGLALVISRNMTTRDHADRQQPFNLRVATTTQTLGAAGKVYDIQYLQFFQADQIRGFGLYSSNAAPRTGRRVIAQPLHDPVALANTPTAPLGPAGAVQVGTDGSMAAFVPARRALTWQLTDPGGAPVVRERFWLTFQPGEIRTCTSCHGLNTRDQANQPVPQNKPEALRTLLRNWKGQTGLGSDTVQPKIMSVLLVDSHHVRLQLRGAASVTQWLQTSPDLHHWMTIGTNVTATGGESQFDDLNEAGPARFYRVLIPTP